MGRRQIKGTAIALIVKTSEWIKVSRSSLGGGAQEILSIEQRNLQSTQDGVGKREKEKQRTWGYVCMWMGAEGRSIGGGRQRSTASWLLVLVPGRN